MSLPDSLIQYQRWYVLSEWIEVDCLVRIDVAFSGDRKGRLALHEFLQSPSFYIHHAGPVKCTRSYVGGLASTSTFTRFVLWLLRRKVKVRAFTSHELCCTEVLEQYLQLFGSSVRHIHPREVLLPKGFAERHTPNQTAFVAQYCNNLRSFFSSPMGAVKGSFLGILRQNPSLKTLHVNSSLGRIEGGLSFPMMVRLTELKCTAGKFGESLVNLTNFTPNLQKLCLQGHSDQSTYIHGALIIAVANSCPGVVSLLAQCTHLHTFHYFVEAGTVTKPKDIDALRSATVVHLRTQSDAILAAIAKHCQQMQVLTMTAASYGGARVWLMVDQLMTFAARCSQLCMVVNQETSYFGDFERLVDYTAVQEGFPKLRFVESMYELNFDVLKMPV